MYPVRAATLAICFQYPFIAVRRCYCVFVSLLLLLWVTLTFAYISMDAMEAIDRAISFAALFTDLKRGKSQIIINLSTKKRVL
jgi:hypothetical protein